MGVMKLLRKWPMHRFLPLVFFAIGLAYLYAAPNLEASDSLRHTGMIKWIAEHGALPVQEAVHDEVYAQQASQPPLYYLLMAPIWSLADTSDFEAYWRRSPLTLAGVPTRLGNRSVVTYRQPYPPDLQGASLTLYLIRLATLGMGAVTVAAVYQAAMTMMPGKKGFALLATAFTAFNPQFLFVATSVSNDALVTMLASLIVWQTLAMLRDGFEARRSLSLACLAAMASLAKVSGLLPGVAAGLAGLWLFVRERDRRGFLIFAASMTLVWLLIAGWWYARNVMLYGELFGTSAMVAHYGARETTVASLLANEFQGLRISYWALFGRFSILVHNAFYHALDALCLVAGAGLASFLWKRRGEHFALQTFALLCLLLLTNLSLLVWWNLQTVASTGRLLFPSIAAISLLLALGLHALRIPALAVTLPLAAFAIAAPFVYIMPEYDHPPVVEALPETAQPAFSRWDDITLIGYELPDLRRYSPGDEIPVTLFWRPLAQSDAFQALFITLIDSRGRDIATIDSFPGWGTLPTTWWRPNASYRDDYIVQIPEDADAVSAVQLHIGWYDWESGANIQPVDEAGAPAAEVILPLGAMVSGGQSLAMDGKTVGVAFGDAIELAAFRFSDGATLELEWRTLRDVAGDWRVFAVVFDAPFELGSDNRIIFQKDTVPPVPLAFLRVGESFVTRHDFALPAGYTGEHRIYVGWYNDDIGARLSVERPADMLALEAQVFRG